MASQPAVKKDIAEPIPIDTLQMPAVRVPFYDFPPQFRDPLPTPVCDTGPDLERRADPNRDRCLVTVFIGPRFTGIYPIEDRELVFGRGNDVTTRIEDPLVSRRHARLWWTDNHYLKLEDLGSTNGTFVHGERVVLPQLVGDGDYIRLGRDVLLRCGLYDAVSQQSVLQLYESSLRDPVTHAFNRRHLEDQLEAELSFASRHESPVALTLFDLDGFKHVNDNHGHTVGDAVLRIVAAAVQRLLRPEDLFARFGGDEFVILARATNARNAEIIAERIRHTVEQLPLSNQREALRITASFGVAARTPASVCSGPLLLSLADRAMYRAKGRGKNRVELITVP